MEGESTRRSEILCEKFFFFLCCTIEQGEEEDEIKRCWRRVGKERERREKFAFCFSRCIAPKEIERRIDGNGGNEYGEPQPTFTKFSIESVDQPVEIYRSIDRPRDNLLSTNRFVPLCERIERVKRESESLDINRYLHTMLRKKESFFFFSFLIQIIRNYKNVFLFPFFFSTTMELYLETLIIRLLLCSRRSALSEVFFFS